MAVVRTVLGDVDPGALGSTNYHEHLFQVSPLLPGDELDDEGASEAEARLLRESGFSAMIDATPTCLGRRPGASARISSRASLHVVASTGAHREEHYCGGAHWILELSEQQLADRFTADVEVGMPAHDQPTSGARAVTPTGEPVRAGLVKAGIGYWRISPFERRVLAAVSQTHSRTGVPVMVHLESGSGAFEVLAVLVAEGVVADAVVLAHIDRNPDPVLHAELAAAGAYLGYDGFARAKDWPDSTLISCLERATELGAGDRLLVGGDVARRSRYVSYGGMPGLAYLGRRVVPRLRSSHVPDLARRVLVDNPARLLTMHGDRPPETSTKGAP
jgi:5-phospho-D-xylono-1,4-lactonase